MLSKAPAILLGMIIPMRFEASSCSGSKEGISRRTLASVIVMLYMYELA